MSAAWVRVIPMSSSPSRNRVRTAGARSNVAARGIDIDDVACVVHYVPPIDVKTYLHRSGRTARAGRDGWAVTLAEYNQHTTCRIIQRGLRLEPQPPIEVFSNDPRLADLASFFSAT